MKRREFLSSAAAVAAVAGAQTILPGCTGEKKSAPKGKFTMTMINPDCMVGGGGQCAILRMPSGKTYLFDTANGDFYGEKTKNNGKDIIAPWLRERGIEKIDGLAISHYHADHFGGFLWLKDNFPIGKIFNNNFTPDFTGLTDHDIKEYKVPRKALDEWGAAHPGCLIENTKEGDDLGWSEPGVKIDVVWPPKDGYVKAIENRQGYPTGDNHFHHLLNANSTALRVETEGKVFFIVGDIQPDYVIEYMVPYLKEKGLWGGDFVVLPGHGLHAHKLTGPIGEMVPYPSAVCASNGNREWMIDYVPTGAQIFTAAGFTYFATNVHGNVTASVEDGKLKIDCDVEKKYKHNPI